MKFSFLSKWTVLILTLITIALIVVGVMLIQSVFGNGLGGWSILAFLGAALVYLIAWFVALFDSIQERRWGWLVALILLSPFLISPLLYSLIGPKNTK